MIAIFLIIIVLCFPSNIFPIDSSQIRTITLLWNKYIESVRNNNLKEALSAWNLFERKKYLKENIFDWQTQMFLWRNKHLFLSLKDTILTTRETDNFIEIVIGWKAKNLSFTEKRYLSRVGNKLYFVSPAIYHRRNYVHKSLDTSIIIILPIEFFLLLN